jgi:hypothetical protein
VIIIPVTRDGRDERDRMGHSGHRLIASFAITNPEGRLVVERAGSPAKLAEAAEDDALVVGFARACARATRSFPAGLRVRVSSQASNEHTREILLASTVAGIAASNALLVLGMTEEEQTDLASQIIGGDHGRIAAVLSKCTTVVYQDCDDTFSA